MRYSTQFVFLNADMLGGVLQLFELRIKYEDMRGFAADHGGLGLTPCGSLMVRAVGTLCLVAPTVCL